MQLVGIRPSEREAREKKFNAKVGGVLKAARLKNGLSLSALAAKMGGVSEGLISRYESGATPMRVVTAAKMCQILGVDFGDLFKREKS